MARSTGGRGPDRGLGQSLALLCLLAAVLVEPIERCDAQSDAAAGDGFAASADLKDQEAEMKTISWTVGKNVGEENHPYVVNVMRANHHCSGALVSDSYVVTPANCVDDGNFTVRVSNFKLHPETSENDNQELRNVQGSPIKHPSFSKENNGWTSYDAALLKLDRPITAYKPISLDKPSGENLTAIGWFRSLTTGQVGEDLQKVHMKLFESSECARVLGANVPEGMFCAQSVPNAPVHCAWDKGALLLSNCAGGKSGECLFGLAAFRVNKDCKESMPYIFTNLDKLRDWIKIEINEREL